MRTIAILAASFISFSASAQVFRCPDAATGRMVYSDAPCTAGEQIVRGRSAEERSLDRERADLARERFLLEQERDSMRRGQVTIRSQPQPYVAPAPASGMSRECEIATKNAWGTNRAQKQREADIICFGASRAADIEAERAARRPLRTNCVHNGNLSRCVTR
jgi:hypothetical protein